MDYWVKSNRQKQGCVGMREGGLGVSRNYQSLIRRGKRDPGDHSQV